MLVPVLSWCLWAQCRKEKNAPLKKLLVEIEREWSIVWLCAGKGQTSAPVCIWVTMYGVQCMGTHICCFNIHIHASADTPLELGYSLEVFSDLF